ncbi:hypothetical protein D3C83_57850 [compost metagenome]
MLPIPPALETAAQKAAEVHEPMGARITGCSIPRSSVSAFLIMTSTPWQYAVSCHQTDESNKPSQNGISFSILSSF